MVRTLFVCAALAALVAAAPRVGAQNPVRWTVAPVGASRHMPNTVTVTADIAKGWHMYAVTQPAGGPIATRIAVPPGTSFVMAGVPTASPAPVVRYDSAFKMKVFTHEGTVRFRVPVRHTTATTSDTLRVDTRYQVCNASLCLPPRTTHLALAVGR